MRYAIVIALLATFSASSAYAWSLDEKTGTNLDGSSRFSDPDDQIPFPHISDDGQMQNASGFNFGSSQGDSGAFSLGISGSQGQPDAFQRAQERMGQ